MSEIRHFNYIAIVLLWCLVKTESKSLHNGAYLFPIFQRGWGEEFYNERGNYFEGDIILRRGWTLGEDIKAGSNAPRWKNGTIPYTIQSNINSRGKQAILAAMQDIERKTCIQFKPRQSRQKDKDYVHITMYNEGCYAYVGRNGGVQQLNLGPGCWSRTTIIHELVHSIGFWHEQSRLDRDKFVEVQWDNIPRVYWKEFSKHSKLNNFNTEYDYKSVMHYSYSAFAKNRGRPTITPKDRSIPWRDLGRGDKFGGLTETDALQINRMYKCPPNDYLSTNLVT